MTLWEADANTTILDLPIPDPHCRRWSDDVLKLEVGARSWTVRWGRYDVFATPAYWIDQTVRYGYAERVRAAAMSSTLESEVVFCLLGGYGVTAEAAQAAHGVVMPLLITNGEPDAAEIEAVLRSPLPVSKHRYRFPHQRAVRIATAVAQLRSNQIPEDPANLRQRLLLLPGVGPKTAAWIVRNHTGSDTVAIIDIWLIRALTYSAVFPSDWRVRLDYGKYEAAFLAYAGYGRVRPAALDLCVWEQARRAGQQAFLATSSNIPARTTLNGEAANGRIW